MLKKYKKKLYEIVFEADTKAGKAFDIILLILIVFSIIAVMLESVPTVKHQWRTGFVITEWIITVLFTIEYILRIWLVKKPIKYIFSFYGIIDLLSVMPTYLEIFIAGTHSLMVIRALRLLRIFRILKLSRYTSQSQIILAALKDSRRKISVFLFGVFMIVIIVGTCMYLIEGSNNGFTSIPKSIYWTIVTITTVGYGDIAPQTPLGQIVASMLMILGYAIIAVPTGIVTVELSKQKGIMQNNTQVCPNCLKEGHDDNAMYCKYCGKEINPKE